nr:methylenetetrahydrofolate dehydrogenase [Hymenolepis microstoma]
MGRLILGNQVASHIIKGIKEEIDLLKMSINFSPVLAVLQVGHREDSDSYLRAQTRTAHQCGIDLKTFYFRPDVTFEDISKQISILNNSPDVHAITIQLPVISNGGLNVNDIVNLIDPNKDVDGLSINQTARLSNGDFRRWEQCPFLIHIPCAAAACLLLLQETESLRPGVRSLVVGRGKLIGIPVFNLLLWSVNATCTVCHCYASTLPEEVQRAEILVAGAGQANLIKGEWIRPGATIIDCGINTVSNSETNICGDVEYEKAVCRAGWITPVPGGIGPLTVALLMRNTLNAAKKSYGIPTDPPLVQPTGVLLSKYTTSNS